MASIIKRGKKYRALVRNKGVTKCKTFQTKSAAKTWAIRIEAELDRSSAGSKSPLRGWTIGLIVDAYVNEIKPYHQWNSSKDSALKIIKRYIGEKPASGFCTEMVMFYAKGRLSEGVSASTLKSGLSNLSSVIDFAIDTLKLDLPSDAVSEARRTLVRYRMLGESVKRDRRPTAEELRLLREHFEASRSKIPMSDIIDFAIASAMRRGEIFRIQWSDLDRDKRTVIIRDRKHPRKKLGNHQTIPLLNGSFEIAVNQLQSNDIIFPYNPQVVTDTFVRACKAMSIKDLRLHDLRHEGISRLFEQGYQVQEVAIVSGHSSWNQLKRYTQLQPESLHR